MDVVTIAFRAELKMASRTLAIALLALCAATALATDKRPLTANSISDGTA